MVKIGVKILFLHRYAIQTLIYNLPIHPGTVDPFLQLTVYAVLIAVVLEDLFH